MNLLMITRKVDKQDARAGFVYAWVKKLSQRVDRLIVICQEKGDVSGLKGIKIYSLGKEKLLNWPVFLRRPIYVFRFYKLIWRLRKKYDNVFVHMHWIYVLLANFFWKLQRKKIGFWYSHIRTTIMAKLASCFADFVFSPSGKSFKFAPKKLKKTGHGIDTEVFRPSGEKKEYSRQIISVGRISPVKEYEVLIEAVRVLAGKYHLNDFEIKLIGRPANKEDFAYLEKLKKTINGYRLENCFNWLGDIPNKDVFKFYQKSDIFVNMQSSGVFDKAVLEAMACGLVCVLSSSAYNKILGKYKEETIFESGNSEEMAEKIYQVSQWSFEKRKDYQTLVINYVRENHNLDNLMNKIVSFYK